MDDNADAKRIRLPSQLVDWKRQPRRPRLTWLSAETSPLYAPQSSRYGSEPPPEEDAVSIWRYAILELHGRNDDPLNR